MGFGQFAVAAKKQQTSLEEASELIRHSTQGKVLSARTTGKGDLKSHRIQVLTPSGRIKVYQVPANNNQNNKNNNRRDNRQNTNYFVNPNKQDNSRSSRNRNSSSKNNRSSSNTNNKQKKQTRTSTSKQSKGEKKQK